MFTPNSLIIRYGGACLMLLALFLSHSTARAGESPPYAAYFNPAKGFKPAQANFQLIFLQMAGSLESSGSPEAYLRHIMEENSRIDGKYRLATGKTGAARPSYFTEEYLERLLRNWNKMAPALALESLARESGRNMRYALMGGWNMSIPELRGLQTGLTTTERDAFRELLQRDWFTKADFPSLEEFYKTSFDKLTEDGKKQISRRVRLGQSDPEKRSDAIAQNKGGTMLLAVLLEHQKKCLAHIDDIATPPADSDTLRRDLTERLRLNDDSVSWEGLKDWERDAFFYSHLIRDGFRKRIDQVRRQAKQPGQAQTIEGYLVGMTGELLVAAEMEFLLALNEDWAKRKPNRN